MTEKKREPSVALWTDGIVTIVLPHVTSAFWAALRKGRERHPYVRAHPDVASMFVIKHGIETVTVLNADGWREAAVEFLRALALYWETRT